MAKLEKKQYVDIADDFKNRCLGECGGPIVVKKQDIEDKKKEVKIFSRHSERP